MGEQFNRQAYHKHLLIMDCRKDIIIENDFINKRIKEKNISFFNKYSQKVKNNKMRLIYLAGFCIFFSLDPIYNGIFDSKLYHKVSSLIFDRSFLPALTELESPRVKYSTKEEKQLGQYFLNFEKRHLHQQIRASLIASRIIEFSSLGDRIIDVNTFVSICQSKGLKTQQLPQL